MTIREKVKRTLAVPAVSRRMTSAVRPAARWLPDSVLFRIPVIRPFSVDVPGTPVTFWLDASSGDSIATTVFWRGLGAYEPSTVDLLLALSRRLSVFIDVGANVGLYSVLMAAVNPATAVHAIEPVPAIFALLKKNADLNSLPNLHLHQVAASVTNGPTVIHVPKDHTVPIEASLLAGFRPNTRPVDVRATTLDSFVEQFCGPDVGLIKIDTEGTTAEVLEGAAVILEKHRPFLICEVLHDIYGDSRVGPVLDELGYSAFRLTRRGPTPTRDVRGDPSFQDLNYFFVHRSRIPELAGLL